MGTSPAKEIIYIHIMCLASQIFELATKQNFLREEVGGATSQLASLVLTVVNIETTAPRV